MRGNVALRWSLRWCSLGLLWCCEDEGAKPYAATHTPPVALASFHAPSEPQTTPLDLSSAAFVRLQLKQGKCRKIFQEEFTGDREKAEWRHRGFLISLVIHNTGVLPLQDVSKLHLKAEVRQDDQFRNPKRSLFNNSIGHVLVTHLAKAAQKKEVERFDGRVAQRKPLNTFSLDQLAAQLQLPILPREKRTIDVYMPLPPGMENTYNDIAIRFALYYGDQHAEEQHDTHLQDVRYVLLSGISRDNKIRARWLRESWLIKDSHRNWWYLTLGIGLVALLI